MIIVRPVEMLQLEISVHILIGGDFVEPSVYDPSEYSTGQYRLIEIAVELL